MKEQLPVHEWAAIVFICSLMVGVAIISRVNQSSIPLSVEKLLPEKIQVEIIGAVKNPGVYEIQKGEALESLLAQAEPLPAANLSKIKKNRTITKQTRIIVPTNTINITINGAVDHSGIVTVPVGTTFQDLKTYVTILPEADHKIFNKKRKLKEGESITIPFKKVKKNPKK